MDQTLESAIRAYSTGQTRQAEDILKILIARDPTAAAPFDILGLIALDAGRKSDAAEWFDEALRRDPQNHQAREHLAIALRGLGRLDAATEHLRAVVAAMPEYNRGLYNLGVLLTESGQPESALAYLRRVVAREPENADAQFALGIALNAVGDPGEAVRCFRHVVEQRPDFVDGYLGLASASAANGEPVSAAEALKAACALRPGDAKLWVNLGEKLDLLKQNKAATAAFDRALAIAPENVGALFGRLRTALRSRQADLARQLLDRLPKIAPRSARVHATIAQFHEAAHRLDEARDAAEQALAIRPGNAIATRVMAHLERRAGDLPAARRRLEAALAGRDFPLHSIELGFVLDRMGEYDAAYAAFAAGQRALADRRRHTRAEDFLSLVEAIQEIVRTIDFAMWPRRPPTDDLATPAFFVGFPRSGTTLMEQMLAGHPDVVTMDEVPFLRHAVATATHPSVALRPYPGNLVELQENGVRQVRRDYWQAVDGAMARPPSSCLLIDKLPLNLIHLPLVRRIFPDARILVALRDPRDVVLSCFMQAFEDNDAMANLSSLADAARLYGRVMDIWLDLRKRGGLASLEYRYENLIADPSAVASRVVSFLGLPWNERVLDYRSRAASRPISTPSYEAVTEPLHERAIGRWRHYRRHIEPVLSVLAPYVRAFGYPAD